MLINLTLVSSLSCLNFGGIKPHKDKMLTKMYNFCPSSLKKEKKMRPHQLTTLYLRKGQTEVAIRLIDKLFTPHIV